MTFGHCEVPQKGGGAGRGAKKDKIIKYIWLVLSV